MNVILIHDLEKLGLPRATRETAAAPVEIQFVCPMIYFPLRADLSSERRSPLHFTASSSIKWAIHTLGRREDYVLRASHPSPLIIKCVLFSTSRVFTRN